MNRTAIWSILFALGLILILMQYEISRYIADSTADFAAGIILAAVSGAGLMFELYAKRK